MGGIALLIYIVKNGDTLWQIAQNFGIGMDALLAANPQLEDPNQLMGGMQIFLPQEDTPAMAPPPNRSPWPNPPGANPSGPRPNQPGAGPRPNTPGAGTLPPGVRPAPPGPYPAPFVYETQGGETLIGIARRYNIPYRYLWRFNRQIIPNQPLPPGMSIFIPLAENVPSPPISDGRRPANVPSFSQRPPIQDTLYPFAAPGPRPMPQAESLAAQPVFAPMPEASPTAMAPETAPVKPVPPLAATEWNKNDPAATEVVKTANHTVLVCPHCGKNITLPSHLDK